jgi:DNA-binding LytR/AlgR family response regulator
MPKALLHVDEGRRRAVDTDTVFFLEARVGDTLLRRRAANPLRDARKIGEIHAIWKKLGFIRIHHSYSVNPDHVLEIRRRAEGSEWEVKLNPPVNRVLPVSRNYLGDLMAAFGERG